MRLAETPRVMRSTSHRFAAGIVAATITALGLVTAAPPLMAQGEPSTPEPPSFLAFVRKDAPRAQPTHHARPGTEIELVLVGRVERATEFSVCLRGKGPDRCWTREIKRPRRGIRIATTAPDAAGRYRVVWRVGEERVGWGLRVSAGRRGDT